MAGTAEFDEFVRTRSRHLLRIAYLLTGDHALAEDLLQTALARSWSAWRRIDGDPEAYVRQVLVNTYNSWWRRRWNGERPTEALPEQPISAPQVAVDERDQVWRALSRLPRQQKLVLVLRYFEDLSEAEIASALGISNGSVKSHASKALAKLRLDPTLRVLPSPGDDDVPAGNERVAAVRERIAQRRRGRLAALIAACAVLLAAVGGYLVAPRADRDEAADRPKIQDVSDFPEYYNGYHTVLRAQVRFDQRPASFTWTPSTLDFAVFPMCKAVLGDDLHVMTKISINGTYVAGSSCYPDELVGGGRITASREGLRAAGVQVGKPATVTLTIGEVETRLADSAPGSVQTWGSGGTPPADGIIAVVIGEPVPFDEFPLPPRPAELKPLTRTYDGGDPESAAMIESGGTHSSTVRWGDKLELLCRSQTPGLLRIRVDGIEVQTMSWWDYRQGGWSAQIDSATPALKDAGFHPAPGTDVTVTVEPQYLTGDWYLTIWSVTG
ncbi:SigE family RNA polymerase sigma factor [Catellatospora tritici]|uniref:SigE family RNA polymerase sigma factor n=1 Tax=Catellatospora tritici TaxID=2851566 RepID=UPI001C2DBA19|nr:SigE family RNA polymerase sigma factor [Catellatospora tritici]MBV1856055.1 SigE family RNA polymerase sigma factor [Catellatospora tritici]